MPESILHFFSAPLFYPLVLLLSAVFSIAGAVFLLTVRNVNAEKRSAVPRMRIPGILLGAVVLLWCIPNAMPVLPESLHKYLLPTALILLILSWIALDHLFARAIAGAMILTAHYALYHSYAEPAFCSSVFAVLLLIFGTIGIWFSGRPYDIRDLIRKSAERKYRCWMPAFLLIFAVFAIMTAICRLAGVPAQ